MAKIILTPKRPGITPRELEYCLGKLEEYPYPIKLSKMPDRSVLEMILMKRHWTHVGENCVGQRTEDARYEIQYAIVCEGFSVHRDEKGNFTGGCWFFVKDRGDYERVLLNLAPLVEDPEPFTITIQSGCGL